MHFGNPEFMAGLLMAFGLLAALFWSSVFRNLALAAFAGLILWVFFKFGGVAGVVMLFRALRDEFARRPTFTQGAALGVLVIIAIVLALRQRRVS